MPAEDPNSSIARALTEVSERASLLIREEIELAKAEVSARITKLLRGVVVAMAAGIFVVVGLLFLLHAAAWGIWEGLDSGHADYWLGFLIVAVLLFLLGALAGFLAFRAVKGGSPPVPTMAIDEARRIRGTVSGEESGV